MKLSEKRFFKYITSFGLFAGISIFFKIRRSKTKGLISFNIPGLEYPVYLRRDTSDFIVFEEIFIDKIYQSELSRSDINVIVDAGANTGLAALYFLQKFRPKKIICIEPENENYKILIKNLGNYNFVSLYNNALWSSNTSLKIKNPVQQSWAFEVEETKENTGAALKSVTLNNIIDMDNLISIDLLKVDIEGSEKEVFETNTQWTDKVKNIIIELHEDLRPGAKGAVLNLISKFDFSCRVIGNTYFFTGIE